jgi:hypothetical protein
MTESGFLVVSRVRSKLLLTPSRQASLKTVSSENEGRPEMVPIVGFYPRTAEHDIFFLHIISLLFVQKYIFPFPVTTAKSMEMYRPIDAAQQSRFCTSPILLCPSCSANTIAAAIYVLILCSYCRQSVTCKKNMNFGYWHCKFARLRL